MAVRYDPQITLKLSIVALSAVIMIGGSWMVLRKSNNLDTATLQTIGIILLIPSILILAITNSLNSHILATLLGGIFGFLFAKTK